MQLLSCSGKYCHFAASRDFFGRGLQGFPVHVSQRLRGLRT
ncbi:hypothetical protein BSU04_26615 [Caballeronia sordidicola]|uniref:Uncharacterized protein n=1 Tax=Caballeronia sordidicola TaxID=196367 RepID=A0A226WXN7_CABSO|nr:hypothetical protein BSU04_26615 [Caballeronia sordidicola]